MRVRIKDIIEIFKKTGNVSSTASILGIHRSTVYRWIKKAKGPRDYLKWRDLKRKSTKPKKINYALSFQKRLDIIQLRKKKGYTAEKIAIKLKLNVSPRTIHRFLKRKGFVRKYGKYRRPRFQNTVHMHAKNAKTIGYLQKGWVFLDKN